MLCPTKTLQKMLLHKACGQAQVIHLFINDHIPTSDDTRDDYITPSGKICKSQLIQKKIGQFMTIMQRAWKNTLKTTIEQFMVIL